MKNTIEELKAKRKHEIEQIGLTPRTNFKGTQEEHDNTHRRKAEEYDNAIKILSSKFAVRDWMTSEIHSFDNDYDKAKDFYAERIKLCEGGETDVELYAIIDAVNDVD